MAVTAALKGSITVTDNLTGSTSLTKLVNNSFAGVLSSFGQSVLVGTSVYTVSIPNSAAQFVYVKNLSVTSGTTITVTWTPAGSSSATIVVLDPGALIVFSEVTTSFGITSMSLVSNQPGTPVEFVLAG